MAQNLGNGVSHVFNSEGYNYDKVVFNDGRPPLASELNLAQELSDLLGRRRTYSTPSGWYKVNDPYTDPSLVYSFLTQDPTKAEPEIAIVNGWPIVVTNTSYQTPFVNRVDLSTVPLLRGARIDGVFLEVWRAVIDEENDGITSPDAVSNISSLNTVFGIDAQTAWAAGTDGSLVKTEDGGMNWVVQPSPTNYSIHAMKWQNKQVGWIAGDNGSLYKTTNGGAYWVKIGLSTNADLRSIAIVGDNDIWVCGGRGALYRSQDGSTFRELVNTQGTSEDLYEVFMYDTIVGWACGSDGVLLRTQDGGESWVRIPIFVNTGTQMERSISNQLNGIKFINLNDGWIVGNGGLILKSTDGGRTWADTSSSVYNNDLQEYTSVTRDLLGIDIYREEPLQINLTLYKANSLSATYFSSASYVVTPTTLVLSYIERSTGSAFSTTLNLAIYPTDQSLVDAINAITQGGLRVFSASLDFSETAYTSHDNTGSLANNNSTQIRFSLGDRAWIVGDDGLVLSTTNSGAQWQIESVPVSFNLIGASFLDSSTGWVVGEQATIVYYDGNQSTPWTRQQTELKNKVQRKIYFEGNTRALNGVNPNNNSIDPNVAIETATRTQIQYRIRVVEGVDINNYQEAGLGAEYVMSLGPNESVADAGSSKFTNMGTMSGDYGCWRAGCRNTADGFCWAIPMFLVSRRNQAPFNFSSNINGSTVQELNIIRPDGILPNQIIGDDIVDIRKNVNFRDLNSEMGKVLDSLLSDKLRTRVKRLSDNGSQEGATYLVNDSFVGLEGNRSVNKLAQGSISSEYTARTIFLGNTTITDGETALIITATDGTGIDASVGKPDASDLTFPRVNNTLYSADSTTYVANYALNEDLDGVAIPGIFAAVGDTQPYFILGQDVGTLTTELRNNADQYGSRIRVTGFSVSSGYVKSGTQIQFSDESGTFYTVVEDCEIRESAAVLSLDRSVANPKRSATVTFQEAVFGPDYPDLLYVISAQRNDYNVPGLRTIPTTPLSVRNADTSSDTLTAYFVGIDESEESRVLFTADSTVPGLKNVVRAVPGTRDFTNQQQTLRSSLVELDYWVQAQETTSILRVPKNYNGYTVYSVRAVIGEGGNNYRIFQLRDREEIAGQSFPSKSNIIIELSEAYRVNSGDIVRIVCEVNSDSQTNPNFTDTVLGITGEDFGESVESYRNSFVATFKSSVGGVDNFCQSILVEAQTGNIEESGVTVSIAAPNGAIVLGMSKYSTREAIDEQYCWFIESTMRDAYINNSVSSYLQTKRVTVVSGIGTSTLTLRLEDLGTATQGTILVPMLLLSSSLPNSLDSSSAQVYYRSSVYQSVDGTLQDVDLSVVINPTQMFVSNAGSGGGIRSLNYGNPVLHIPTPDSITTNASFFNPDGLWIDGCFVETGFTAVPLQDSPIVGGSLILSNPTMDRLGRAYYRNSDQNLTWSTRPMLKPAPRKVFVPLLVKVNSDVVAPFLRGEVLLMVVSKTLNMQLENVIDLGVASSDTQVALYRLPRMPMVR